MQARHALNHCRQASLIVLWVKCDTAAPLLSDAASCLHWRMCALRTSMLKRLHATLSSCCRCLAVFIPTAAKLAPCQWVHLSHFLHNWALKRLIAVTDTQEYPIASSFRFRESFLVTVMNRKLRQCMCTAVVPWFDQSVRPCLDTVILAHELVRSALRV